MKKKNTAIVVALVLFILCTLFIIEKNKYTNDERKFSKEYSYVLKNNNVEYITEDELGKYTKDGTHIILITNPKVKSSKKLITALVDKVIEYNKTLYYYNNINTKNNKTAEVWFIKNGKIIKKISATEINDKTELYEQIDSAIDNLSKEVCEINSKC